jgi:hypothetical protein
MTFADGYVDVATRIAEFYAKYPDGSLQMDPPKYDTIEGQLFLVGRAYAYRSPDDVRPGIGHAWEAVPGRTPYTKGSELMVLETSAWGRALAALGIATKAGVASSDEIKAAEARRDGTPTGAVRGPAARAMTGQATEKQVGMLVRLMREQNVTEPILNDFAKDRLGFELPAEGLAKLTKGQASALIDAMTKVKAEDAAKTTRSSAPLSDDPWANLPVMGPDGEVAQ